MKMFVKIFMKIMGVIEWIVTILIGFFLILFLFFFLDGAIISSMHGNAKAVTITRINKKNVSLDLPIRLIPVKGASMESSQTYMYNATIKKYWGTAWKIGFIPEEKRIFIASSHVGVLFPFLYHYAITDPEAEKALLAHLKTIEPERIIK